MDIDKFVLLNLMLILSECFGSLMDIDKFVPIEPLSLKIPRFGSLMDIDKFVQYTFFNQSGLVSVL